MGCILVLFLFLKIIKVKFTIFFYFWIFDFFIGLLWLKITKKNFIEVSQTTFTYKILDEITVTQAGQAWKVQNFIFCHFWEPKNLLHKRIFKYMPCAQFSSFFLNAHNNVLNNNHVLKIIRINNNWNYQKIPSYHRMVPLRQWFPTAVPWHGPVPRELLTVPQSNRVARQF